MLHRLAIICITGFWLAMTGLLVVRELYPESTRLNAVPLGYVGQIVFQHEQSSDLRILSLGKESDAKSRDLGFIHIQPRNERATGKRILEMNGSINFKLPGGNAQHLSFVAQYEMGRDFAPLLLHLDISANEPGQRLDVTVDYAAKKASFGAKLGEQVLNETAFTLDEAGFGSLMSRAGVDPTLVRQLKASQGELPKFDFSAQSSSIVLAGQKLSTFLLTMKSGGQNAIEVQLSQLGQVLSANAPALGWKFVPFNLSR